MVDVGEKEPSDRRAVARAVVHMAPATIEALRRGDAPKGDVVGTARIAGIQAAKRTAELIPLCHTLPLSDVQVSITPDASLPGLRVEAAVRTAGKTGVEIEAITAVSVTLITVYDMAKAVDRGMLISDIQLLEKAGGRSGHWKRA